MKINRDLSTRTWKQIEEQLLLIKQRARETKDNNIRVQADRALALLQNLSIEIVMEDERASEKSN